MEAPLASQSSALRVLIEHTDVARLAFNRSASHLEAWQVVSYTMSAIFLLAWIRRLTVSDKPLLGRLRSFVYSAMRALPWVREGVERSLEQAKQDIEDEIHHDDPQREFYKFIPERGLVGEDIINEARQYAQMGERLGLGTVHADPRTRECDMKTLLQVFDIFSYSDPHRSDAFPGSRKMEAEVLKMVASMLHCTHIACGAVVSGGTEAILLACLAYRNRALSRGVQRPEIVCPSTAHPAFDKAAKLFDMRITKVPVNGDDRVDVRAMRRLISADTCLLVASAPNHVTGTIDDVERISELASRFSLPLHVDASLGGFLLPFLEFSDFHCPAYDYRLSGVTSISVDLHRYGQCPRRCSVLTYRDDSWFKYQCFSQPDWRGGVYATPTILGGRDGGAVAAAWATILLKGRDGYMDATARIVGGTRKLADCINHLEGIGTMGGADLCMVTIRTTEVDVYALADKLVEKGWHCDPLLHPSAARIPITLAMCEEGVIEELVEDIEDGIAELKSDPTYARQSKTAAFYGMVQRVGDRSLVEEILLLRLSAHYSMPSPTERRAMRSVSVDGRKLSMIGQSATDMQMAAVRAVARIRREQKAES